MHAKPTCETCGGPHPTALHSAALSGGEAQQPDNREAMSEHLELQDRLRTIIRTVCGKPDLEVTTRLNDAMRARMAMDGTDPKDAWFRYAETDPISKRVIREYVRIPERIFESTENVAKGKAAHEGGHVIITRSAEFVPERVLRQMGFTSLLMSAEERPTDQVVRDRFPGAGDWVDEARRDGTKPTAAETDERRQMGYIPKFQQLANLIVYAPHYESLPPLYEADVIAVYEKIRADVEKLEHTLPAEGTGEAEAKAKAIERYKITYSRLWPEFKKLIEQDLQNEELRQMVEQAKNGGLPQEQDPLADLDEAMRQELEQALKDMLKEMAGGEGEDGQEGSDGEEGEGGEKGPTPMPMNKLGEQLRNALRQVFDKLPEKVKEQLRQQARKMLERIEDGIVKERASALTDAPMPTHEGARRREERDAKEGAEAEARAERDRRREEKEAEARRQLEEVERQIENFGASDEYERTFQEVREGIDQVYRDLEQIFTPQVKSKPVYRSTGSQISLKKVYKWDSARKAGARNIDSRIFETISVPEKKDYAITLLVDLSGSMYGEKIEETFKAVVLLAEVLNRLGVKFEVKGFQDELIDFKDFDKDMDDRVRRRIAGMPLEVEGTNPDGHNNPNNNDDGPCLAGASRSLAEQPAKQKFLIVLSDGQPAGSHSDERDLHDAVENIRSTTDQKLVALGLGRGTGHVRAYYPNALPDLSVKELVDQLGELIKDIIVNPQKYQ